MSQSIDKIFNQIAKNSKAMAIESINSAMQRAYKLSLKKAKSCLKEYYKWQPAYYRRTNKLINAIKGIPPKDTVSGKHMHAIRFAVLYDSSFLDGAYHSNSWYHQSGSEWKSVAQYQTFNQNNGIPDSGWILENYLYGIHPRYVGTPETGIVNNSVQDGTTTMSEMTKFFQEELPGMIGDMVTSEMQNSILKLIQG